MDNLILTEQEKDIILQLRKDDIEREKVVKNTVNSSEQCRYTPDDVKKLVSYILDWWKEHEYDTTGDYGEYNVYNSDPSFVTKAQMMRDKGV